MCLCRTRQQQLQVSVAKGNVDASGGAVEAGDGQCHGQLPAAVVVRALPHVVGGEDVVGDCSGGGHSRVYNRVQNRREIDREH